MSDINKGFVRNEENFSHRSEMSVYRDDGSSQHVYTEEHTCIVDEVPYDDNVAEVRFEVTKVRDQGLVSGWANVAIGADGKPPLDWQGDVIAPEVLEKAAINFMLDYRDSGEMHKGTSKGTVVESIVMTKEKQTAMGIPDGFVPEGWFITVKVNDAETLAKVKAGHYKMFSIQGSAKRVEQ